MLPPKMGTLSTVEELVLGAHFKLRAGHLRTSLDFAQVKHGADICTAHLDFHLGFCGKSTQLSG